MLSSSLTSLARQTQYQSTKWNVGTLPAAYHHTMIEQPRVEILHFRRNGRTQRSISIQQLLDGDELVFLADHALGFTWVHVPVNDTGHVDVS